jgi:hypothetical protein
MSAEQQGPGAQPNAQVAGGAQVAKTSEALIQYFDRPTCDEIFADSVVKLFFDGQSLRIELGVTRLDGIPPSGPMTGNRYTACRLILPPSAAVELINRMQQIAAALTQAGIVKPNVPNSTT